jgi:hypothetical protein
MIKKLYLQLFAEGAATSETNSETKESDAKTETGKTTEQDQKPASQPKYTDDDVDKMFARKFAEWKKNEDKKVAEAKKLAEMNATQKAEYERDQLQNELDALKKKDALAEMTKTARKMLTDSDITVSDELLAVMVTTDAEETKNAIDGFTKAFKEAVESAVKERLRGEPPKKGTSGVQSMTKAQIMAIKDPELRQKKMLEHRELFNF